MDSLFNFSFKKTKTGIMEPLREEDLLLTAEKIRANAINSLVYLIRALRIDDGKDYTDDELLQMRRDLGYAVQAFHNFFESMSYEARLAWQEAQERLPEDQRDPRPPDSVYHLMFPDVKEGEYRTGRQGMQDAARANKAREEYYEKRKKVAREATRRMKKELAKERKGRSIKIKPTTGSGKGKLKKTNKRKTTRKTTRKRK